MHAYIRKYVLAYTHRNTNTYAYINTQIHTRTCIQGAVVSISFDFLVLAMGVQSRKEL